MNVICLLSMVWQLWMLVVLPVMECSGYLPDLEMNSLAYEAKQPLILIGKERPCKNYHICLQQILCINKTRTHTIYSIYCPCNTENGHLSVLQQHWQYQNRTQPDNTQHPRSTFWTNLRPLLQDWTTKGDQIILGIDANEDI